MIIAVDFDNTLVFGGKANDELIDYLIKERKNGSRVILWTCRQGMERVRAIEFCRKKGLIFDGIAENKVFADFYVDSKARKPEEIIGLKSKINGRQRMTRLGEQRGQ